MMKDKIEKQYYNWLIARCYKPKIYSELYRHMYHTKFDYILDLDGNRVSDGEQLRYKFGKVAGIDDFTIQRYLDYKACSVLEMIVALALRLEITYMYDSNSDEHSDYWIRDMLISLGLEYATNTRYNYEQIDDILYRFMDRDFEYNGAGGLATVNDPPQDMRNVEIWCQMMWYIGDLRKGEDYD